MQEEKVKLKAEVQEAIDIFQKGLSGQTLKIPIGKGLFIIPSTYWLLGGAAGTGKTSVTDTLFVYNAIKYAKENNIKLHIFYFSFERKKAYKIIKWTCMQLLIKYQIHLSTLDVINVIDNGKNHEYKDQILDCFNDINDLLDYVTLIDDKENPTGIFKKLTKYFEQTGTIHKKNVLIGDEEVSMFSHYEAKEPDKFVFCVIDHIGKVPSESGMDKKRTIDKMSEYLGILRDRFSLVPIVISQFNRELTDVQRKKQGELHPQDSDFKDSGNLYEDCDFAFALFHPAKYGYTTYFNYHINKLTIESDQAEEDGACMIRTADLLKSSYGAENKTFGLNFHGKSGYVRFLPKPSVMNSGSKEDIDRRYKKALNFEI